MKQFLKYLLGGLLVLVVVFGGFFLWIGMKSSEITAAVSPTIEKSVPLVATWDIEQFKHLVSPDALYAFENEKGKKIFRYFSKIGKLKSFAKPKLVRSQSSTSENGTYVIFSVEAIFEKGSGLLTLVLVPSDNNEYLIRSVNLNSDVFFDL